VLLIKFIILNVDFLPKQRRFLGARTAHDKNLMPVCAWPSMAVIRASIYNVAYALAAYCTRIPRNIHTAVQEKSNQSSMPSNIARVNLLHDFMWLAEMDSWQSLTEDCTDKFHAVGRDIQRRGPDFRHQHDAL
jgi:hypothetical protein